MYVVDFASKTATTVSIVPSDAENPAEQWIARGAAGEVPARVESVPDATPPALIARIYAGVNTPFTLALAEPGHPLLAAPLALPDIDDVSENVVVLGDKFYATATVRGKRGHLIEVDPRAGTTRVLKTKGAKMGEIYPAGDKLAIVYARAKKSTIGLYDVTTERFTVEVTLPDEVRRECEKGGPINELGIFWLAVAPDAASVRATFSCYVND
jgi:hypothetical protein